MASILPSGVQTVAFNAGPSAKLYRQPVGLDTPKSAMGPNSVRLDIDWSAAPYLASTLNPVVAVEVDLLGSAVQTPLDQIRSVYIDNSNSITPIYVQFPDTDFVIQCPPRSVAWQPVLTGQQKAIIMGVGFVSNLVPVSRIHFTNIDVAGYVVPIVGSNLVRGQFASKGDNGGVVASSFSIGNPQSSDRAPDRLLVAAIAVAGNVAGTPNITNVRFRTTGTGGADYPAGSSLVTVGVSGGANNWQMGLFRALCPGGTNIGTMLFDTAIACRAASVGVWSLYNTSDIDPIWADSSTSGTTPGALNLSPFVTQDGFCCLSAGERVAGPGDTAWTNALENAQSNVDVLEFSLASINGSADNYVPVIANTVTAMLGGTWN